METPFLILIKNWKLNLYKKSSKLFSKLSFQYLRSRRPCFDTSNPMRSITIDRSIELSNRELRGAIGRRGKEGRVSCRGRGTIEEDRVRVSLAVAEELGRGLVLPRLPHERPQKVTHISGQRELGWPRARGTYPAHDFSPLVSIDLDILSVNIRLSKCLLFFPSTRIQDFSSKLFSNFIVGESLKLKAELMSRFLLYCCSFEGIFWSKRNLKNFERHD